MRPEDGCISFCRPNKRRRRQNAKGTSWLEWEQGVKHLDGGGAPLDEVGQLALADALQALVHLRGVHLPLQQKPHVIDPQPALHKYFLWDLPPLQQQCRLQDKQWQR